MLGLFHERRKSAWIKAVFTEPLPDEDIVSEDRLHRSTQRILKWHKENVFLG